MRLFDPRPLAAPTVLLAVALALPSLQGCATTCTSDALKSGLSALPQGHSAHDVANLVANSCASNDELTGWLRNPESAVPKTSTLWTSTCPAGADPKLATTDPLLASRKTLYESCDLSRYNLGDQAATSENLALAAAVTQALIDEKNVDADTARAVGSAVLGSADIVLPDVPLSRREVVGDVVAPSKMRVTLGPKGVALDGKNIATLESIALAPPFQATGHAVESLVSATSELPDTGWSMAIADGVKFDVIHRVVASIGRPGHPLELAVMATRKGEDHRPHRISLHVPATAPSVALRPGPGDGWMIYDGDTPRAPIDGCPTPGATVCHVGRQPMKAVFGQLTGDVALQLPHTATTTDLYSWLESAQERKFSLDDRFAPCSDAPDGMVCIPGGATVFGDGRDAPAGEPTLATLSTFYLDQDEITHEQYAQCTEEGACESVASGKAGAPVENLSYWRASYYCAWAGKRLPSEFEFERAARPPGQPPADLRKSDKPGDAKPTCKQANHAACGGALTAANKGPLNGWGVRNLLGNVAEFTTTLPRSAGECEDCDGWNPQGPCDGAFMCKPHSTRVIRGGSFRDSADKTTPASRTNVRWTRPYAGVGMRCAASEPVLATFPPAWTQEPTAPPAAPSPLSDADRSLMLGIAEDQIDEIPECEQAMRGHARTDCKDPTHYIYPNEDRAHITFPYIKNRGGALLGVGSDQNYTYAAIARSELLFLLDYDAIVIHIHRVNQAFIKVSETPDDFVAKWDPKNFAAAQQLISNEWAGDPMLDTYKRTHKSLNRLMHGHYQRTRGKSEFGATSWLRDAGHYKWVRDLWLQGRVRSLKGDMMGPNAMAGVGRVLHELDVPMRIYYTSNAPNAWGGEMTPGYRSNVRGFPMDDDSVVLQALGWVNEFGQTGHWHFNVQRGSEVQDRLAKPGFQKLWRVVRPYRPTDDVDLTLSSLPGTWEDSHRD